VTNERLYVGNLSYDASESDLFELFNGSGRVQNAEVVVNNHTQRSKGFAFVTMMSVDEAKKAVADLNGKDFMGRPLVVGGAKPMPAREDRPNREEREESDEAEEQIESSANEAPGDGSKPEMAA
jgi:RNA recognition motif-containing protein